MLRFWSCGTIRVVLGPFAGNSSWSTQRQVYEPARAQPICTSHGHTAQAPAGGDLAAQRFAAGDEQRRARRHRNDRLTQSQRSVRVGEQIGEVLLDPGLRDVHPPAGVVR